MMPRPRALALAIALALALFAAGRLATPTRWYAAHGAYRAQVDALLAGRLALTEAPDAMAHDLAWTEHGVQQVWGLGVPLWQAPFEALGRAVGLSPFPDRVALLVWLALVFYVALRAWCRADQPWWRGAGCVLVTVLLPPFVTLLRGRLGVYEEAAAYTYGAAMLLLAGTERLRQSPGRARYLVLVAAAGLVGLIRPTVWFYGLATLIVATVVRRPRLRELALGVALFVAGGAALYATNAQRFGSGGEFGHRLNLESLSGNIYATRFSYPFARAGLPEAAEELVGGLFGRPERHWKRGFYERDLHVGQSTLPRWREFYFTTLSWPYLPLILVGLVVATIAWRRRDGPARWLSAWAVLGGGPLAWFYLSAPSMTSRYQLDLAPAIAALLVIAWRTLARRRFTLGVLAAGWVAAVVTARIATPRVAPVDREAAAQTTYAISRAVVVDHPLPDAYDLADPWLPTYTDVAPAYDRCADETGTPIDPDAPPIAGDTCVHGERTGSRWVVWTTGVREDPPLVCEPRPPWCAPEPTAATAGEITGSYAPPPALYLNASRWDLATGAVPPAFYVWVREPRFVELDVRGPAGTDWAHAIQVAIGPTHLALSSIADLPDLRADRRPGVRLRFETRAPLPEGPAVAFFAVGPDTQLDQATTPFAITKIRWR